MELQKGKNVNRILFLEDKNHFVNKKVNAVQIIDKTL